MEYVAGIDLAQYVKKHGPCRSAGPASSSGQARWACSTPMKRAWSTATSSRTTCCWRAGGVSPLLKRQKQGPRQGADAPPLTDGLVKILKNFTWAWRR